MPKITPSPLLPKKDGTNLPNQKSGTVEVYKPNPSFDIASPQAKQGRRRWRRDEIIDP